MRIAILSDIHGNLVAFEAVLQDLDRRAPDEVWCGGDIAWGAPWAAQCIAKVREMGWPSVKGNTDVWITGDPQTVESQEERDEMRRFAAAHEVGEADARWLLNLPLGHSGPGSVLLVHGTPVSPFDAPEPDAPAAAFAPYQGQANVVVYGHVHEAFVRRLADGTLVCNAGSVGMPRDAPSACYLLIDVDGPERVLRHCRVPYDRDLTIARAREIGGVVAERFVGRLSEWQR